MSSLNLPPYEIKIQEKDNKRVIFDVLRRKYVALTPEEWVRQHFIHFLVNYKHYPAGLLANEIEIKIGDKRLRCDTVLYDRALQPRMIIEYKAPTVTLNQKVFDQVFTYNILLHVDYLIISNGMHHICCKIDKENHRYTFLEDIPDYEQLGVNENK